jgi:hypothetical protein
MEFCEALFIMESWRQSLFLCSATKTSIVKFRKTDVFFASNAHYGSCLLYLVSKSLVKLKCRKFMPATPTSASVLDSISEFMS